METCSTVNRNRSVTSDGTSTNNTEAAATQSSTNGLNRNVSATAGEPSLKNLDEPKTSKKSLCDRILGLWLIRKIITFFKELFGSGEVTDSATAHKYHKDNDPLVLEANSLSSATLELDSKIRTHIDLNDNLPEIKEDLEKCVSRLAQLKTGIASANRSRDLEKTVTEIEQSIDWMKFCITDAETDTRNDSGEMPLKDNPGTSRTKDKPRIVVLNRDYYDDFVALRYEKAQKVLQDHKPQLAEIEAIRKQYEQAADAVVLDHNGNNFTSEMKIITASLKYDLLKVIYHIEQQGQRQN